MSPSLLSSVGLRGHPQYQCGPSKRSVALLGLALSLVLATLLFVGSSSSGIFENSAKSVWLNNGLSLARTNTSEVSIISTFSGGDGEKESEIASSNGTDSNIRGHHTERSEPKESWENRENSPQKPRGDRVEEHAELFLERIAKECTEEQRDVKTECFVAEDGFFGEDKMWVPFSLSLLNSNSNSGSRCLGSDHSRRRLHRGCFGVNDGVGLYVAWYRLTWGLIIDTETSNSKEQDEQKRNRAHQTVGGYTSLNKLMEADTFKITSFVGNHQGDGDPRSSGSSSVLSSQTSAHPVVPLHIDDVRPEDKEDVVEGESFFMGPKTQGLQLKLLRTPYHVHGSLGKNVSNSNAEGRIKEIKTNEEQQGNGGRRNGNGNGPTVFVLADEAARLSRLQQHLFYSLFNHSIARRAMFAHYYHVRRNRKRMKRQPLPAPLVPALGLPAQHPFITFHRNFLKPLEIVWFQVVHKPPVGPEHGGRRDKERGEGEKESRYEIIRQQLAIIIKGGQPAEEGGTARLSSSSLSSRDDQRNTALTVIPIRGVGYFQSHVSGASYTNMWHTFGDFFNLLFHTLGQFWTAEAEDVAATAVNVNDGTDESSSPHTRTLPSLIPLTWVTRTPFSIQRKDCRTAVHCRSHSLFDPFRRAFNDKIVFIDDDAEGDDAKEIDGDKMSMIEGYANNRGDDESSQFFKGRRAWLRKYCVKNSTNPTSSISIAYHDLCGYNVATTEGTDTHLKRRKRRRLELQARTYLPIRVEDESSAFSSEVSSKSPTFLHFEFVFVGLKNKCCPIPMTGVGTPVCQQSYRKMRDFTLGKLYGLEPSLRVCQYGNVSRTAQGEEVEVVGLSTRDSAHRFRVTPTAPNADTLTITTATANNDNNNNNNTPFIKCIPPFIHIMSRQKDKYRHMTPFDEMVAEIKKAAAQHYTAEHYTRRRGGSSSTSRSLPLSPPLLPIIPAEVIVLHGGMTFREQLVTIYTSSLLVAGRGGGTALSLFLPLGGAYLSISGDDEWNPWRDLVPHWYHFRHYRAKFVHHLDPNRPPQLFNGGVDGNRAAYKVDPLAVGRAVADMLQLIDGQN